MDLAPPRATLHHLIRTDPDPRVRDRADGVLLVAGGMSLTEAARVVGCARTSLRRWGERYLAEGRDGLADRARPGRPPKRAAAAGDLLDGALAASPLDYAYPVTSWTVADLTDLRGRHGSAVSPATVSRTLAARG